MGLGLKGTVEPNLTIFSPNVTELAPKYDCIRPKYDCILRNKLYFPQKESGICSKYSKLVLYLRPIVE